ncbi:MAG: hypothetical protein L0287_08295 [Anaerolineae bacterium]|nr:hypothetical protein [Anaerolineae bacterium]
MTKTKPTAATTARRVLLFTWLGFFVLNLSVVLVFFLARWIEDDNFKAAVKQFNASYAPYLGAILLYYWGSAGKTSTVNTGLPLQLALICSALWNILITMLLLMLPIEEALENITEVGGYFSWLVAGAIGYYFASPGGGSDSLTRKRNKK